MPTPSGKVTIIDGDGNTLTTVELDENGQATFDYTLTGRDVGIKTLKAVYTGDDNFKRGTSDEFTVQVGSTVTSQRLTVDKIVAGSGIYISPENGRGTVTIASAFIPQGPITDNLYCLSWPNEYPGVISPYNLKQFTAAGANGSNVRSRDGEGFARMGNYAGYDILGLSSEMAMEIPNGHFEYNGVGGSKSIYGRLSNIFCGDGMEVVSELTALNSGVTGLKTTFAFRNGGDYCDSFPEIEGTDYGIAPQVTMGGDTTAFCDTAANISWSIASPVPITSLTISDGTTTTTLSTSTVSYSPGVLSATKTYTVTAVNEYGTGVGTRTLSYTVVNPITLFGGTVDSSSNAVLNWQLRTNCPIQSLTLSYGGSTQTLSTATRTYNIGTLANTTTYTLGVVNCCGTFTSETTLVPVPQGSTGTVIYPTFQTVYHTSKTPTTTVEYPDKDLGIYVYLNTADDSHTNKVYNFTMNGDNADRRLNVSGSLTGGVTTGTYMRYYIPLIYNDGTQKGILNYADTYGGAAYPGNYTLVASVTADGAFSLASSISIRVD